jgi:mono/diheme cytochrome c family protein
MPRYAILAGLLGLAAFVAGGCSSRGSDRVTRGHTIYAQHCAICHGPLGQGAEAPGLRNESSRRNDAQLRAWIENPAPPMPHLYPDPLNDEDVADVAAYVESLK